MLRAYNEEVKSVFQLMGNSENDITKSVAWAFDRCPAFLSKILGKILGYSTSCNNIYINYQHYERGLGITDLEITDNDNFFIVIEAKRGWLLPGLEQIEKYANRKEFLNKNIKDKYIVSMSECSQEYAKNYMCKSTVCDAKGIKLKHLSWQTISNAINSAKRESNNTQKRILDELKIYMGGIMRMQNVDSNWVYVVSLGNYNACDTNLTWIDIVEKKKKYFCPNGKNWLKDAPNYIAFRYYGKLQGIYHIEDYVVTKNLHDEIEELPDKEESVPHFVFTLGEKILPNKDVHTGNIFRNGRVWAMLDTLLTSNTISEARDISKQRSEKKCE